MMSYKARLQQLAVFPFLLPLFYVLHTLQYLHNGIPAAGVLQVWLLYTAITAAVFWPLRKWLASGIGAGLATVSVIGLFIYWGELIRAINRLAGTQNFTHLPVVLLGWVALSLWLGRIVARRPLPARGRLMFFMNTLFLLYVLVEAGRVGYEAGRRRPPMITRTDTAMDRQLVPRATPGLYLLLLDEYSSTASLLQEWGFDNRAMDSALMRRGFHLSTDSRSNYHMTFFSMASMLNMDYLSPAFERSYIDAPDYPECQRWLLQPRAVALLQQAGYRFHNLSIFDMAGQPKPDLKDLLVNGRDLLTVNNLYHVARRDYLPYLEHRQEIRQDPEFHDPAFYYTDTYNNRRIAQVLDGAGRGGAPSFVYAHFLMPHFPFYYDSSGKYLPVAAARATIEHKAPKLYGYNVLHANRAVLRMVDTVLRRENGNAVILVMSDHGFRPQGPAKHPDELFRNYCAVYFPDRDYQMVPDRLTNVNVFRVVFNKIFGTHYPLLPDHWTELQGALR